MDDKHTQTPAPSPESTETPQPAPQAPTDAPSVASADPVTAEPVPAPAPVTSDWQPKAEYAAQQTAVAPVQYSSKVSKFFVYALGISVLLIIITAATPVGELLSVNGSDGRSGTSTTRPLFALSLIAALIAYFGMTIAGIAEKARTSTKRILSIIGLVIGAVLIANPFGFIILFFMIQCNLTVCQAT